MDELLRAIQSIVDKRLNNVLSIPVQLATVTSVDKDKCSCEVQLSNNVKLEEVNLRAVLDNSKKGFVVFPKVNSMVLIGTIENMENNAFVLMCSEITDITIDAKVVFNGGLKKGLLMLEQTVGKLNNLENAFNELSAKYNTHIHTGGTIAGSTGISTTPNTTTLTPTTEEELKNDDIKQ